MDNEDAPHLLNESEWDQIPPFYTLLDDDGDTVIIGDTFTDSSVFPSSNHEDLPVIPQEPSRPPSSPPSIAESDGDGNREDRLRAMFRVLKSGIVSLAHKVRAFSIRGSGNWSTAVATGGAVAVIFVMAALCMRVKRWRRWRHSLSQQQNMDYFKVLIMEKDQRIKQLLLQIADMNEALSRSRRIPVHRVG